MPFAALDPGARRVLDGVPDLVDRVFPLPGRFRSGLPRDVAELSRAFTGGRGGRSASYLGKPHFLSAYLRYFLPWNLYRLCRLLPGLPLTLRAGDVITDLGSGPLTLPAALWIARPDLRALPLRFRCIDQTGAALEAGKRFFSALLAADAGKGRAECPWQIRTVRSRDPRHTRTRPAEGASPVTASLVTAVNFFNELYEDIPHAGRGGLRRFAEKSARLLTAPAPETAGAAAPAGAVLVVEPGVPRAGEFISALRDSLGELGYGPAAPCPHAGPCPAPGGREGGAKKRWCHFAFGTGDAPPALLKLSAAAGIPKERAALSFLLAGPPPVSAPVSPQVPAPPEPPDPAKGLPVRILSDPFPLPGG
ncbi:MAG: small ribosomal subunit Rsm22 family protein, partial [Treponema sp.]|nr:small ribosomal subunit Rsm22 family protein [Treponema sp.]